MLYVAASVLAAILLSDTWWVSLLMSVVLTILLGSLSSLADRVTLLITWVHSWSSPDLAETLSLVRDKGEWALVTGCTDGIGLEIARVLRSHGFKLLLVGRNMTKLESLLNELQGDHIAFQFDFSDKLDSSALKYLIAGKRLSLLVNNAGMCHDNSSFCDMSEEAIETSIRINITSTILLSRVVLPFLVDGGVMMNVSSGSSLMPCPYLSVYSATKSFLNQWAHSVRLEMNDGTKRGVKVQNYTPYYVATKLSHLSPTMTIPDAREWAESALARLGCGDTTGYIFHDMMRYMLLYLLPVTAAESYMTRTNRPK